MNYSSLDWEEIERRLDEALETEKRYEILMQVSNMLNSELRCAKALIEINMQKSFTVNTLLDEMETAIDAFDQVKSQLNK